VCSHSIDKRSILENYDLVALCIDEICDDGYVQRCIWIILTFFLCLGLFWRLTLRIFVLELRNLRRLILRMSRLIFLSKDY
jgi:hypothetical protein